MHLVHADTRKHGPKTGQHLEYGYPDVYEKYTLGAAGEGGGAGSNKFVPLSCNGRKSIDRPFDERKRHKCEEKERKGKDTRRPPPACVHLAKEDCVEDRFGDVISCAKVMDGASLIISKGRVIWYLRNVRFSA
jgi:hypothetical protein